MKSKRAKACDISESVKRKVWERDNHRCIICGSEIAMPNAHFISRTKGGLGIEENIVTLCTNFSICKCHFRFDNGSKQERNEIKQKIESYLKSKYENWNIENLIFRRKV